MKARSAFTVRSGRPFPPRASDPCAKATRSPSNASRGTPYMCGERLCIPGPSPRFRGNNHLEEIMEYMILFLFLVLIIAALVFASKAIYIVPQATVLLIERLGKFSRVAAGGLNIITPLLDRPRGVYWTGFRPG